MQYSQGVLGEVFKTEGGKMNHRFDDVYSQAKALIGKLEGIAENADLERYSKEELADVRSNLERAWRALCRRKRSRIVLTK